MTKTLKIGNKSLWSWFGMLAVAVCLGACTSEPRTFGQFVNLPAQGWQARLPIEFLPEYSDSSCTYDLTLAVRHASTFGYNNLCLSLDMVDADGKVTRKEVNFTIADEYGNFKGGGFGDFYQLEHKVATGITPHDVSHVVVWQAMKGCDTIQGLKDIGIFLTKKI